MKQVSPFSIKLPLDIRQWVEKQAGQRKMTMTDYVLQLLVKGIQAESIDATVARISGACETGGMKEVLRQTLITRYIVEAYARGAIRIPERLGTDAVVWADKELSRILAGVGK